MALTGRAASRNEAWLAQGAHCPTSLGASTAEEVLGMPPLRPAAAGKETPHRLLAVWGLPARAPRPAGSGARTPRPFGQSPAGGAWLSGPLADGQGLPLALSVTLRCAFQAKCQQSGYSPILLAVFLEQTSN